MSKFIVDSHGASSDIITTVNIRQDAVESWQRCSNSKKFHQILINYLVQLLRSPIDFVFKTSKNFLIHLILITKLGWTDGCVTSIYFLLFTLDLCKTWKHFRIQREKLCAVEPTSPVKHFSSFRVEWISRNF